MENQNCRSPLISEKIAKWIIAKIREYKVPILASFLVGLLAYMFAFTNKLVNGDDVFTLFFKGGSLTLGRWGLELFDNIFPNYSMPWIYGVITIVLMAVSVCFIIHIFHIQSKLLQVLLAGTIIAFPSLIGVFSYMFMGSTYSSSFLLAVLAVWLLKQQPKKGFLPAVLCMILSLSLYQGFIALAASLLVLILIQQLMEADDVVPVIRRGIWFVLFLVVSLGLYYGATQLILLYTGAQFNSYANGNISFSLSSIPADIVQAYLCFIRLFDEGYHGLVPTALSRRVHYLCIAAVGVLFLIWAFSQKKRKPASFLLLFALMEILPLAINCMYLFTTIDAVHTLVLYSFVAVYILAVIIAEACMPLLTDSKLRDLCRRIALDVVAFGMAAVIIINIYIANESYLNMYLRYENTYAFYTSLVADIKMMPEFDENTKLALIGNYQSPDFYQENFEFADRIMGVLGFLPHSYARESYLEYYLGFPLLCASDAEIAEITASPEYVEMAVYPYYGSMRMIGDILVVKLS